MRTPQTLRGGSRAAITLLGIALLVGACGGGAQAADNDTNPDDTAAAAEILDGDAAPAGESADEAWIARAIDALYARESFTFEMSSTTEGSSGIEIRRTNGTVRPADASSVVNFEIGGSVSQYVTIADESWVDYGDGNYLSQETPDLSGEAVRTVWDERFAGYAHKFVVVGHETIHGQATTHVVIDPGVVEDQVQMFGEKYRAWTIDLWLAEDDGHLVRGIFGGPQAPLSYSVPQLAVDVTSIDCECPVHDPS